MDGYFNYLLSIIDNGMVEDYTIMLDILYRIDFRWSIHNDDNRAIDGFDIRYNYQEDLGVDGKELEELLLIPCTVIEVICGLAIRMDEIMRDPYERHINRWFWELLGNLGLTNFTNEAFEKGVWSQEDVTKIVDIFMDRTYDELGRGGLFPRKFCGKNQKVTELFAQMNGYLNENYC